MTSPLMKELGKHECVKILDGDHVLTEHTRVELQSVAHQLTCDADQILPFIRFRDEKGIDSFLQMGPNLTGIYRGSKSEKQHRPLF